MRIPLQSGLEMNGVEHSTEAAWRPHDSRYRQDLRSALGMTGFVRPKSCAAELPRALTACLSPNMQLS